MSRSVDKMLQREAIANRPKHWVRLVTACNNKCLFCLDMDTPRNQYLSENDVKAEIRRGFEELGATKVILSGGEASVHPLFPEFIRFALELGYERVQTVTNGLRYGDRRFFESVMAAGLGEITFSLHGHTAGLHDYLVQTPGSFDKLIKGLIRAKRHQARHGWPIVNIDVVINGENVAVLDKIVELGVSLGVKEYDLLHVIPQAEAYRQRDRMFYEVREHLPVLQKVFKLNRRPDFHIWTNRFPVAWLEGLEDLIQDPHKMVDEVRGRKFHVRRYIDEGEPLECREPDRCTHCFIEPFCTTMERTIDDQHQERVDVFVSEDAEVELPFGARLLGWTPQDAPLPPRPLYLRIEGAAALPEGLEGVVVATEPEQLAAWLPLPLGVELEIQLNRRTAPWMLANSEVLDPNTMRIHQPSWEKMEEAHAHDVRDPAAFFTALGRRLPVSGLPACLSPGVMLHPGLRILDAALFDPDRGRLDWRELAHDHVKNHYKGKSARCEDCRINSRCEGLSINMVRDQGLGILKPLIDGDWAEEAEAQMHLRHPEPPARIATGMPPQAVAPSLPGFPEPGPAPEDPLRRENGIRRSDLLGDRGLT